METREARTWPLVAALFLGYGASLALRVTVVDEGAARRRLEGLAPSDVVSPGSDVLHLVALQHSLGLADLTWLAIVQEIGRASTVSDAGWDRVERWSDIAIDLDPRYFTVYHSVGINLSVWAHRVDASDKILLRGLAALPHRWELPMVLGYNAYFMRGDAILGSDYMSQAGALPDAPKFLAALAGRMRYHGGDELGAIELLETMLPALDARAAEETMSRIKLLRSELHMRAYDDGCKRYLEQHGSRPADGEALVAAGLAPAPATDLFDGKITLDADCIARTEMVHVREFEAKKRVGIYGSSTATISPELQVVPN